jgi:hypothetical protein
MFERLRGHGMWPVMHELAKRSRYPAPAPLTGLGA